MENSCDLIAHINQSGLLFQLKYFNCESSKAIMTNIGITDKITLCRNSQLCEMLFIQVTKFNVAKGL